MMSDQRFARGNHVVPNAGKWKGVVCRVESVVGHSVTCLNLDAVLPMEQMVFLDSMLDHYAPKLTAPDRTLPITGTAKTLDGRVDMLEQVVAKLTTPAEDIALAEQAVLDGYMRSRTDGPVKIAGYDERALKDAVVEAAIEVSLTLDGGFVLCENCGEQETTGDMDNVPELIAAVEALRLFRTPKAEEVPAPDEDERKWLIWYHDPDMPPELIVRGGNAEQAARQRHKDQLCAWSCHLFREVLPGEEFSSPAKPLPAEIEVSRLRAALIDAGRAAGAILADDVSTDFLMHVPHEVTAVIDKLRAKFSTPKAERPARQSGVCPRCGNVAPHGPTISHCQHCGYSDNAVASVMSIESKARGEA